MTPRERQALARLTRRAQYWFAAVAILFAISLLTNWMEQEPQPVEVKRDPFAALDQKARQMVGFDEISKFKGDDNE